MTKKPTTSRKKSVVRALLIFLACGAALILLRAREPRYNGRSLTSWLQQYVDASLSDTNQLTEARNAIRNIGAKQCLPILLRLAAAKEGAFHKYALSISQKLHLGLIHPRDYVQSQLCGIDGFEALGTNAAPAIDTLTRMLSSDDDSAFVAFRCLESIGKPAEGALCQCLTNDDWRVRDQSISALASVTDDVAKYISRVKDSLNDSNSTVRVAAVEGIGAQIDAPDLAIPILKETLKSTDDMVSAKSAEAIGSFGTNGASAFSSLTNLIASGRRGPAGAAVLTIAAISPSGAVPVLSNTIFHGDYSLWSRALTSLNSIDPGLSAQMTLAELRSPDPECRLQALKVTGIAFGLNTPGIVEALKSASHDDNPQVAQDANKVIKYMLRRQKEKTHGAVSFPEDPKYQGKPLGEWLQMRHDGWSLSTNAVEALRQMGTNAIPPLLHRLEYKDPVFGFPDFDINMEGVSGLISLRDLAKPALPRLAELMDSTNQDLVIHAMLASLGTGQEAMPCLVKGLTNQFPDVRSQAASCLTSDLISQRPEARQQAVPHLVELLNDPDQNVQMSAANALKELDPRAAANAGLK